MAKEDYKNFQNNNVAKEIKETAKDAAREFTSSKEYSEVKNMAKNFAMKDYAEISEIRDDLNSLKSNVIALTKHLQRDGKERVSEIGDAVWKGVDIVREKGEESFNAIEDTIRENPRRSTLIAFGVGLLTSLLLSSGKRG